MRDDLDGPDRRCSSNAQVCSSRMGSSLGAEFVGMQLRSSSSEDGNSPRERAHGMALDSDSATEAEAAGNHLRSSDWVRTHRRARQHACLPLVVAVAIDPTCNSEGSLISRSSIPPLNIHLKQVPFAETFATPRHSSVVQPGSEPTLRVYGTTRCLPTTHLAPEILTRRNTWELLSCLRFDPEFSEKTAPSEWQRHRVVSANFAEWLMGLSQ